MPRRNITALPDPAFNTPYPTLWRLLEDWERQAWTNYLDIGPGALVFDGWQAYNSAIHLFSFAQDRLRSAGEPYIRTPPAGLVHYLNRDMEYYRDRARRIPPGYPF